MRIGTAGWSLNRDPAALFPGDGHQLQRYARVLNCVEINSSFYRPHQPATYARWAALTPPDFRFAVKLPRTITHEARLGEAGEEALQRFLGETAELGGKLAVILVQLPPSLAFDARAQRPFFERLAARTPAAIVCEPRHASWFDTPAADAALADWRIARAGADPARRPSAAQPGGWLGPAGAGRGALLYWRWHGSPQLYRSPYTRDWLAQRLAELRRWPAAAEHWCIFDNTAQGAALPNALELRALELQALAGD
ncbi:DUF72 domain-containing protein [Roseateles violae]|uniref:DUF72 domain-containing protein n=1 Tax=Roseateles violae TaxID=3058042 RepID=A0ABT8DSY2_9BURK|nr:DUF72 domain-containing protein [Pelomonas sp. PFR6]MDN3921429.1 DUF72 domain-containing protein [Pelomonas sp. PFR6]